MIDYQLKKCCDECPYLDFDYEQHRVDWDMCHPSVLETIIFCKQAKVCEKYNRSENDLISKPKLAKATSGRYPWKKED